MAKHALIITLVKNDGAGVTIQEFANKELATSAAESYQKALAYTMCKVYTVIVPIE